MVTYIQTSLDSSYLVMFHMVDLSNVQGPPGMQTPIYLVVETSGSNLEHDFGKLEAFLEEAHNDEIIADGTIAQDSSQQASIWNLRESISEGLRHAGTPSGCSSLLLFHLGSQTDQKRWARQDAAITRCWQSASSCSSCTKTVASSGLCVSTYVYQGQSHQCCMPATFICDFVILSL